MDAPHDPLDTPDLLRQVAEWAVAYVSESGARRVGPDAEALIGLASFDPQLPDAPADPAEVLAELHRVGSPATVVSTGPRYFGFVTGATVPAALGASWLARVWDQNGGLAAMSPVAAHLDALALTWIRELLHLPATSGAAFVTGATMGNVSALLAARNAVLRKVGWDVAAQGLFGAPPITVVVGAEGHSSLMKALSMVGLGTDRVLRLPVDAQGAIDPNDLPELVGPAIVCLQAGNVNSGSCDPFVPLVAWAHAQDAWVHVDGAFGLWAQASPARRHLVDGVADADSWATDAHKWLNTPYDAGIVVVRDPRDLTGAFALEAAYLPSSDGRDPLDWGPEFSQRARGVEVWAALASLGRTGVADLVERCCTLAARAAQGFASGGLEVLNDVVLNQVVVAVGDADRTAAVVQAVQDAGVCWVGPTVWRERSAIRFSVSGWRTSAADIDRSVANIVDIALT